MRFIQKALCLVPLCNSNPALPLLDDRLPVAAYNTDAAKQGKHLP